MATKKQENTYRAARDIGIKLMKKAEEDNENAWFDMTTIALGGTGAECIDTRTLRVARLMKDPKMIAAFKKFCTGIVGTMQYLEEDTPDEAFH